MYVMRIIEDVTSISWIFVLLVCFIALIEVGHYTPHLITTCVISI